MDPIHVSPSEIHISKCFFSLPSTSHSISHLPVSFACSSVLLHPALAVRMTELYPSCHQEENGRHHRGGWRGGRTALPAILASAMTCCDTRERSARHTRFISFYSGLSVTSQPAGPPSPPHHTHTYPDTREDAVKWGDYSCRNAPSPAPPPHSTVTAPVVPQLSVGPHLLLNLLTQGSQRDINSHRRRSASHPRCPMLPNWAVVVYSQCGLLHSQCPDRSDSSVISSRSVQFTETEDSEPPLCFPPRRGLRDCFFFLLSSSVVMVTAVNSIML